MKNASTQNTLTFAEAPASKMLALLAGALLISALAMYLATMDALLTGAYIAGLLVLLGGVFIADRLRGDTVASELISPDWSVTVAAIESGNNPVAITDRANRLVCANAAFIDAFGASSAPPSLPMDRPELEAMSRMARNAWRDGAAGTEGKDSDALIDSKRVEWVITAKRAGRGDDHLIWRFSRNASEARNALSDIDLAGSLGIMLGKAGIESAIAGGDGVIRSVSPGFAERAAGDETATLAGRDFVSLLRADERDRIFFAREGRAGTPQTLIDVPLSEPPQAGISLGADDGASLMAAH